MMININSNPELYPTCYNALRDTSINVFTTNEIQNFQI